MLPIIIDSLRGDIIIIDSLRGDEETPETTTTEKYVTGTTSAEWATRSREATGVAVQLSDAVVSYLNDRSNLASVEELVAPSAQPGLAQMLSLLVQPTEYEVTRVSGSGSSNVVEVRLLFVGGESKQQEFTLTVLAGPDETTITAIESTLAKEAGTAEPATAETTEEPTTTATETADAYRQALQALWAAEHDFERVVNPFSLVDATQGGLERLRRDRSLWDSTNSLVDVDRLLAEHDLSWSDDGMVFDWKKAKFEDFWEVRRARREADALEAEAALADIDDNLTRAALLAADLEVSERALLDEVRRGIEAEVKAITEFLPLEAAVDEHRDGRLRRFATLDKMIDQGASFTECRAVIEEELLPEYDRSIEVGKRAREQAEAFREARLASLRARESALSRLASRAGFDLPLFLDTIVESGTPGTK